MKKASHSDIGVIDGEPNTNKELPAKSIKKFKKQKKLKPKHLIIIGIIIIALAGGGYFLYNLFLGEEDKIVKTDTTAYGSLSTTIEGTGTTMPADSETYKLAADAEILEVAVSVGDEVEAGQLLFRQDSSDVDEQIEEYEDSIDENEDNIEEYQNNIEDYQESIADYEEQISEIHADIAALTITAPSSGRLIDVSVEEGDTIKSGDVLATLVNDDKMTLTQYFSYAYEDDIYVGQSATVSVADLMLNLTGTVTAVEKVERVTTEGTKCFAVTITVNNPGALTEGMSVGGYLKGADGTYIYPSIDGTLEYYSSIDITAEGAGELIACNATDYAKVTAGETIFQISSEDYDDQIEALQKQIESAQKQIESAENQITRAKESITALETKIAEAEESYSQYDVYSDISGKVMFCNIEEGDDGEQSAVAVMIYNLDTMSISVNIDELDIDYIETGMEVQITREGATGTTEYTGTVTEVSLEASTSGGVSTFPVTITIESGGELSPGVSVSYYISPDDTDDTDETVLCPVAAIQYLDEGEVVFVQADEAPENTIDLSDSDIEVPEGFYPVLVETGTSNATYIRILSGLEEDMTVFVGYQEEDPGIGDDTSENESSTQTTMPDMSNMQGPGGNSSGGPTGGGGMP